MFLQGSYANNTNTRGDSDVDVVVMMTSTFMPDLSRLSAPEKQYHQLHRIPGTTSAADFRAMSSARNRSYYGSARVESKNKCLRVARTAGYVDADVVPAQQHRLFTSYSPSGYAEWVEGYLDPTLRGGRIVNYPRSTSRTARPRTVRQTGIQACGPAG